MGILELKDVTLDLGGKRVLDHLSLDFREGHIHALVGPNGAGKSTTANVIVGLAGYREYQGDILLDGESIKEMTVDERARHGITLAWQEPARFEGLSVRAFLNASAKNKSDDQLREVLDMVGLNPDGYLGRALDKTLSGGERKRVEMASILAMEPRLVLMDEPDSGIDVEALEHIFDNLTKLKAKGTTVILITHSLAVLQHAEHAFLMCCGRLLDEGAVKQIAPYFENKCIPCDHKNRPDADLAATGS
ncbi:MAG: ABC transporter ATP-binding protein [Kiritimatiellia bacterium]